jgi:hypothetical protein
MDELAYVYATAFVIITYFLAQAFARRFDPFAPIWLFLVGYGQLYVIQPLSYHGWAVGVRGASVVAAANWRSLWALCWFLVVYHLNVGRLVAPVLPRPPRAWSPVVVTVLSPPMILWGLYCCGVLIQSGGEGAAPTSPEAALLGSFPFVMMVAANLMIVTGRNLRAPRPIFLVLGVVVAAFYVIIWTFNGKRSPSLVAVLTTLCALYVTRLKRPSWPVLLSTAFTGALVVAVAIGWRSDRDHPRTAAGFVSFLADFRVSRILESLNVSDGEEEDRWTYESEEYGGFLLMMDTVPDKSDYDYGANYIRVFSTFIPRIIWDDKPLYGRKAWINAWIAGSEMEREEDFAGPAIGLMGATQLNGGAVGTFIVVAAVATMLRGAYEYFRHYAEVPWVQFWWSVTYYNAWLMVVTDDPLVWFYYSWGFSVFPIVVLTWFANKLTRPASAAVAPIPAYA